MNSPALFSPMPLALPEPIDSWLSRNFQIEPWMLAETHTEFCELALRMDHHKGPKDYMVAFEALDDVLRGLRVGTDKYRKLGDYKVRQVWRHSITGKVLMDEMECAYTVLTNRHECLAVNIAQAALERRRTKRFEAKFRREWQQRRKAA